MPPAALQRKGRVGPSGSSLKAPVTTPRWLIAMPCERPLPPWMPTMPLPTLQTKAFSRPCAFSAVPATCPASFRPATYTLPAPGEISLTAAPSKKKPAARPPLTIEKATCPAALMCG